MKMLEIFFLILTIFVPILFSVIALINYKKIKRNKKYRKKIITIIIGSLLINTTIYGIIKNNNDVIKKENNTDKIEEKNDKNTEKESDTIKPVLNNNKTNKGYEIKVINGVTYIDGYLIVNKTYSLPENYIPTNTYKSVGIDTGICQECIKEEAYNAYTMMKNDANKEGLSIWIASGYRSYNYQKVLYNNYVNRSGKDSADTFSARPGHSEHQSALAFDLNSVSDAFATTKEGIWINKNCHKYGFIIRYPKGKELETGYKYEPWHLRYVGKELAEKLYNNGNWITMEEYFGITSKYEE